MNFFKYSSLNFNWKKIISSLEHRGTDFTNYLIIIIRIIRVNLLFRVPEKKICLTGLPQLRPPPKHVIRTRAVHETFERSPFLTGVPHLPHLTLSGASKTVMKREIDRTDGQKHKKVKHKKKKERFPYLKPSSPTEPTRTMWSKLWNIPTHEPHVSLLHRNRYLKISPRQHNGAV